MVLTVVLTIALGVTPASTQKYVHIDMIFLSQGIDCTCVLVRAYRAR